MAVLRLCVGLWMMQGRGPYTPGRTRQASPPPHHFAAKSRPHPHRPAACTHHHVRPLPRGGVEALEVRKAELR
jgi:hypothetical protein